VYTSCAPREVQSGPRQTSTWARVTP